MNIVWKQLGGATALRSQDGLVASRGSIACLALATFLLVARAVLAGTDHDEDQYIGGAMLAMDGMIFRDFMHLQTPLQAWIFAPLAKLFPTDLYLALRIANGLIAGGVLVVAYIAQRALGASRGAALAGAIMLGLCQSFQHSASVVRNDMLPALFSTLALLAGIIASQRPAAATWAWGLCGLAFGLATSVKISHAFLPAATGLLLLAKLALASDRRTAGLDLLGFGAGGVAGLLPSIVAFASAPDAFLWGVVEYGATAPFDWYRANGLDVRLGLAGKLSATIKILSRGPGLVALIIVATIMLHRRRERPRPAMTLVDTVAVAGLIAGFLPTPTWPYYFMTALPAIFIRLGPALDGLRTQSPPLRAVVIAALAAGTVMSVDWKMRAVLATPLAQADVLNIQQRARWYGDRMREAGARGTIATLSARTMVGSGFPLDRRFATGVFVYRSGSLLTPDEHRRFHTVGPATLAQSLDANPPAAIIVGRQNGTELFSIKPDAGLIDYAKSRRYRPIASPNGGVTELYIHPRFAPAR
jgi:hypothetical protein